MQVKTFEEVQGIQRRFMGQHLGGSAFLSVGISKDEDGNFCLYVLGTADADLKAVPSEFEGVKVISRVTTLPVAQNS